MFYSNTQKGRKGLRRFKCFIQIHKKGEKIQNYFNELRWLPMESYKLLKVQIIAILLGSKKEIEWNWKTERKCIIQISWWGKSLLKNGHSLFHLSWIFSFVRPKHSECVLFNEMYQKSVRAISTRGRVTQASFTFLSKRNLDCRIAFFVL